MAWTRSYHSLIRLATVLVVGAILSLATGCAAPRPTTSQPAVTKSTGPAGESIEGETSPADDGFDANLVPGRIHFVQPNETLYSLAERYYGHGKHWRKILAANRNRLKNATDLPVGMRLIIP